MMRKINLDMSKRRKSLGEPLFNKTKIITVALLFLMLLSSNVSAIGVSPGRTTLDFEPSLEITQKINILNKDHKRFNAMIYVEGELKDNVILDENLIEFTEKEDKKKLGFKFRMPERIEKPGDHWAKIFIMEMPADKDIEELQGSFVFATTAVVHQVRVKVPYPGKYAELDMVITDTEPLKPVTFYVKVHNLVVVGHCRNYVEELSNFHH